MKAILNEPMDEGEERPTITQVPVKTLTEAQAVAAMAKQG